MCAVVSARRLGNILQLQYLKPPKCVTPLEVQARCRLLDVVGDNTPLQDAFLLADDVLRQVRASCALQGLECQLSPSHGYLLRSMMASAR